MASAQICLGGNALALHFRAPRVVTLVLPVAALTLVSYALIVWVRQQKSGSKLAESDGPEGG
jgi:hypothetical protein